MGMGLYVDPDQMARVFTNLIKNAREALERESERRRTSRRITCDCAEDTATALTEISISDNGPGLPPRARENLFVAFEGSARAGGTGLGLAIARELIEAHGGQLSYEPLDARHALCRDTCRRARALASNSSATPVRELHPRPVSRPKTTLRHRHDFSRHGWPCIGSKPRYKVFAPVNAVTPRSPGARSSAG